MQNGEYCAKVKGVPPKPSSLWGENVGKIYSTWNFAKTYSVANTSRNRYKSESPKARKGGLDQSMTGYELNESKIKKGVTSEMTGYAFES